MSDEELCRRFGTTLAQVEADVEKYESGDLSGFEFGDPIDGRPTPKMVTSSVKFYDFELKAIDAAAQKLGLSRSAFIRRACDNEVVSLS